MVCNLSINTRGHDYNIHILNIEMCAGRNLKRFLEEPAARLPQYLQNLAGVYVAFENEAGTFPLFRFCYINTIHTNDKLCIFRIIRQR